MDGQDKMTKLATNKHCGTILKKYVDYVYRGG